MGKRLSLMWPQDTMVAGLIFAPPQIARLNLLLANFRRRIIVRTNVYRHEDAS
jgi:hypothetical protein